MPAGRIHRFFLVFCIGCRNINHWDISAPAVWVNRQNRRFIDRELLAVQCSALWTSPLILRSPKLYPLYSGVLVCLEGAVVELVHSLGAGQPEGVFVAAVHHPVYLFGKGSH